MITFNSRVNWPKGTEQLLEMSYKVRLPQKNPADNDGQIVIFLPVKKGKTKENGHFAHKK